MSRCILAARGAGKLIIDGVHLDINDEKGLIDSCIQGRNLGFDGKSLIHPSQILATNTYFSPSESELLYAYKVVKDYEIALAAGKAVVVVENKLVEKVKIQVDAVLRPY
jgi:citrate lyase subunit beta/citryl-CoA lyase